MSSLEPFLCIGTIFASFHSAGKVPELKLSRNRIERGCAKDAAHSFNTFPGIPSGPHALLGFISERSFSIL